MRDLTFVVVHHPSNDECEAETMAAARVAAETLIKDNEWTGSCRIWRDVPTEVESGVLFADPPAPSRELMGVFNAGVPDSYAIGGWWKYPKEERDG